MNFLQSPFFWIALVIAAIGVISFISMMRRRSNWGFKDVVKNPGYWEEAKHAKKEVEATARAAQGWSDQKIAAAARKYVLLAASSRDAWDQARVLQGLGEKTHAAVLGMLRDASLHDRLVRPTGENLGPEAPLSRACDLLGDVPSEEAVGALAPFLDDPSEQIRKDAVLAVAKTGAATIVPHVRKAFADPDNYVRSYALMGLKFALKRKGLADSARPELFPDVKRLLEADKNSDDAANILFLLDAEKASQLFLSPEVFRADSPIVAHTLKVLASAKIAAPRERILALISALEETELKYPATYALGEALRLLGQHQKPEDCEFLASRMTHPEGRVAEGAASGLLCSHGLEEFNQRIWEAEEKSGYDSLSDRQKYYAAVIICDGEINNGGLAQYFVNSSGNTWRDVIAGLEAMESKERLGILKGAVAAFGPEGPSKDRDKRQDQLSKLYRKNDEIFEDLDSRYYKSREVVDVLTARFVIANADSFR